MLPLPVRCDPLIIHRGERDRGRPFPRPYGWMSTLLCVNSELSISCLTAVYYEYVIIYFIVTYKNKGLALTQTLIEKLTPEALINNENVMLVILFFQFHTIAVVSSGGGKTVIRAVIEMIAHVEGLVMCRNALVE